MVQLLKDQFLGFGSYGAVCTARSGELLCAAKILNPNLLDPTMMYRIRDPQGHSEACWHETKWLEEECRFLFELRHPNLVQYLGLCHDPDTKLPVFLMELMNDSLTHFLKAPRTISYHTQVDICHDIAEALSFLHSSNIIHKNLCSNNVLMDDSCTAKLTDYGMAMLADLNPRKIHLPFLALQDKLEYMPPEAIKDEPVYTEKMDCFSFGVIIIQILTRLSPKPANRFKSIKMTKEQRGLPRSLSVPVSEVERRQGQIDLIARNHPLLSVALHCLKDVSVERPSAKQLCSSVAALKVRTDYRESVRSSQTTKEKFEKATDTKDRQIVDLQTKVDKLTKELARKDYIIAASQSEAEKLKKQLEEKDANLTQLEEIDKQLQRQFSNKSGSLEEGSKEEPVKTSSSGGQNGNCCYFVRGEEEV